MANVKGIPIPTRRHESHDAEALDRRSFLRLGGAALAGLAGAGALEGCHRAKPHRAAVPHLAALTLRLPWVASAESGGEFLARDAGTYSAEGFTSVALLPGGPDGAAAEMVVVNGQALVAITSLDAAAAAIAKGAAIKVLGAEYQQSPFCITSASASPLNTPQDMAGKKIGVQAANGALWAAFLKANRLSADKVKMVSAGFDPAPLAQRQVDGWLSYITNEPVALGLSGFQTHTFLLGDYNHAEVGNVFIATTDALKTNRSAIKACLTAEIATWRECIAKPNEAAQATVKGNPTAQTLAAAQQQSLAQNQLIATGDALTHGLFYVSPPAQAHNITTLAGGGITVTAGQLFDLTMLDEIYADRSDLKAVPLRGNI